ncbi:UNVERIFIED_CONTAM: hypothetical protein GTU68_012631 [Idotea baltica]|nr:hypothetical protein [Idotea baltica]
MNNTIALGSDHAGYNYKKIIKDLLVKQGITALDFGTDSSESVDYPDYIHPVADVIKDGKANLGIIFCGSGNGVAMTANKHPHIRAAIAWNTEIAELARLHNDANVLAIPARYVDEKQLIDIVNSFIKAVFEGGRHARRVSKITTPDQSLTC